MPKPFSFGSVELDVAPGADQALAEADPEEPFRIAILGDFSGRMNRDVSSWDQLAGCRPLLVDRDNFDEVMAQLGVELHLPVGDDDGARIALRFAELDDFHPDRIFENVTLFRELRKRRAKLNDSSTFKAAAADLHYTEPRQSSPSAAISRLLDSGDLLEQMLGETERRDVPQANPPRSEGELETLLRKIVAPHLVPRPDPKQAEVVAQVDEAISELMRSVLHSPDFQAIEAAWRGVFLLVRRLERDTQLKIYLIDISKAELAADVASSELRSTGTYRLLVELARTRPWAVVAGNYIFDQTREDVELLGCLARIARDARAPFVSACSPRMLGCESLAETPDPAQWRSAEAERNLGWQALRRLPEASYLGLALPRFLLRLPYGKETDSVELFDFEEMPNTSRHESYLWGNPVFACIYLLGQAFSEYGWNLRPGVFQEVDGLPLHIFRQDDQSMLKPCAEVSLTHKAAEIILEQGLMPLLSIKDRDAARLGRFQSIAKPAAPLRGRWA